MGDKKYERMESSDRKGDGVFMDLCLRKGSQADMDECVEALIHSELGRKYFTEKKSAIAALEEGLASGNLYVAVNRGEFAGFLHYLPKGAFHSFPYLHLLVVKEAFRGKGVGSFMLSAWENLVDANKLFLCVADFNPEAKRFYEAHGYRQAGEIPGLYREGITEFLMMKKR